MIEIQQFKLNDWKEAKKCSPAQFGCAGATHLCLVNEEQQMLLPQIEVNQLKTEKNEIQHLKKKSKCSKQL